MPAKSRRLQTEVKRLLILKLCGCLAVALSGLAVGLMKSKALYSRLDTLKRFDVFFSTLATILRYNADEIRASTAAAARASGLEFMSAEQNREIPFDTSWEQAVGNLPKTYALDNSDKELLISFGTKLGKTDVEGQLSHIELYRAMWQKRLSLAGEAAAQKSRLYKTLGLFGGVSAALLIL